MRDIINRITGIIKSGGGGSRTRVLDCDLKASTGIAAYYILIVSRHRQRHPYYHSLLLVFPLSGNRQPLR